MTTQYERESLRAALQARLQTLRESLTAQVAGESREHFRDTAGEVTDAGDESVGDEIADSRNALIGLHMREVREIEAALLRMTDGTYGRCSDCGSAIDHRRLEANPSCLRCQACQREFERRHAGGTHSSL